MLCKSCLKNPASIKFTEVVDGKAIQHYLCPECYKALQETPSGFSFSVPSPTLHESATDKTDASAEKNKLARCPGCGAMASQLLESAEAGCPTCFTIFGREINTLLEGLQLGAVHRGKIFKCDDERLRYSKNMQEKRVLLRQMIQEENYEEAARLRDEIARMEAEAQASTIPG